MSRPSLFRFLGVALAFPATRVAPALPDLPT
jgi:hypothetical protein